jgi:hypothetical protein
MNQGNVNKETNSNTQAHLEKKIFFTCSNYVGIISQLQTSTQQKNTLKESTTSKIVEKLFLFKEVNKQIFIGLYRFTARSPDL